MAHEVVIVIVSRAFTFIVSRIGQYSKAEPILKWPKHLRHCLQRKFKITLLPIPVTASFGHYLRIDRILSLLRPSVRIYLTNIQIMETLSEDRQIKHPIYTKYNDLVWYRIKIFKHNNKNNIQKQICLCLACS